MNKKLLITFTLIALSGCSADSYESCVDSVVKKAKTETAVSVGVNNCREKFSSKDLLIKDCSVTWSGKEFKKGKPEKIDNYISIRISDTTHTVFVPNDMKTDVIENLIKENMSFIKDICPF